VLSDGGHLLVAFQAGDGEEVHRNRRVRHRLLADPFPPLPERKSPGHSSRRGSNHTRKPCATRNSRTNPPRRPSSLLATSSLAGSSSARTPRCRRSMTTWDRDNGTRDMGPRTRVRAARALAISRQRAGVMR
jgi:hypothetical protein